MKRKYTETDRKVARLRSQLPRWNYGRQVKVYSAYSKKGAQLLQMAQRNIGYTLHDVYTTWSDEKEEAYIDCWNMYTNSPNAHSFHICSASPRFFTVSFQTDEDISYFTHMTEYLIVF